ncbi:unnamed protein product, partial [Mycena citricolor]
PNAHIPPRGTSPDNGRTHSNPFGFGVGVGGILAPRGISQDISLIDCVRADRHQILVRSDERVIMSRHPGRARHVRKEGLRGETTHRKPHRGRYHQYRVLHFSQYAVLHKTYESRALAFDADEICFDSEQGNCVSNVVRGEAVASKGNRYPAVVEEAGIVNLTLHTQLTNTLTENLARNIIDRTHGAFARIDSAPGGNETAKGALRTAHQYFRELGQAHCVN